MSLRFTHADKKAEEKRAVEKAYQEVMGSMLSLMIHTHAVLELIRSTLRSTLSVPLSIGEKARLNSYTRKLTNSIDDVNIMKTDIENHKEEITRKGNFSDYFTASVVGLKEEIVNREKFLAEVNNVVNSYRNKGTPSRRSSPTPSLTSRTQRRTPSPTSRTQRRTPSPTSRTVKGTAIGGNGSRKASMKSRKQTRTK
jgi:hypothetical protein